MAYKVVNNKKGVSHQFRTIAGEEIPRKFQEITLETATQEQLEFLYEKCGCQVDIAKEETKAAAK